MGQECFTKDEAHQSRIASLALTLTFCLVLVTFFSAPTFKEELSVFSDEICILKLFRALGTNLGVKNMDGSLSLTQI